MAEIYSKRVCITCVGMLSWIYIQWYSEWDDCSPVSCLCLPYYKLQPSNIICICEALGCSPHLVLWLTNNELQHSNIICVSAICGVCLTCYTQDHVILPEAHMGVDSIAPQKYTLGGPSVRPSVCPFVTPFSPCSHHRIIMKFSGVITMVRSDVHAKGQGQRSNVKVTEVNTQLSRFRTLTPVWIHTWQWNHAYSWKQHRRGAPIWVKFDDF